MLTFKMSNINSKLLENVYTMGVERNENIQKRNLHEELHEEIP